MSYFPWGFKARFSLLFVVAIFLAACQTNPASSGPGKAEPAIQSSLRANGKGVPNGRTDSAAPYLRTTKMEVASDPEYGFSENKPVRTGPAPLRLHLLYLNSLRGPHGEVVEYERKGACCAFADKSLPFGGGLIDVYTLKLDGSSEVITLYVDMYRPGPPQLPVGFTARQ